MLARKVTISPEVLVQEVGGEAVLLDLDSEKYFGLDETGTRIWQLLNETDDLQKVYDAMLAEYEVAEDRLRTDLIELVDDMAEAGIVTVEPDSDNEASNS